MLITSNATAQSTTCSVLGRPNFSWPPMMQALVLLLVADLRSLNSHLSFHPAIDMNYQNDGQERLDRLASHY